MQDNTCTVTTATVDGQQAALEAAQAREAPEAAQAREAQTRVPAFRVLPVDYSRDCSGC